MTNRHPYNLLIMSLLRRGRPRLYMWVFLLLWATASAQDIHFSQIDVNPILLNPAYNGFFNGTGRVGMAVRNQWAAVGKAYQTYALNAEVSLQRRRRQRDGLSLGLWAYSDRAGELHYGTTAATAALSYYLALDRDGGVFLSGGLEVGCGQSGFNPEEASLLDPEELPANPGTTYPLVGAGLALYVQPNDDLYFKFGASGRNLNQPVISHFNSPEVHLKRKLNLYARMEYRAWSQLALLPVALAQWQRQMSEYVVGCDLKWYIAESGGDQLSLSGGLRYRWGDALYMEYLLEWNALLVALSYDANLSRLTPASHSIGAFELALVYRVNTQRTTKRKALPCPVI